VFIFNDLGFVYAQAHVTYAQTHEPSKPLHPNNMFCFNDLNSDWRFPRPFLWFMVLVFMVIGLVWIWSDFAASLCLIVKS
jgi:hypothetical protein